VTVRVHVVCFGNALHGDDGFGRHVFRGLPPEIEAFDAGIAGLDALPYFEGCAKAVIVDALRTGAPAGTVHRLAPDDLAPPVGALSLHELGVSGLLAALGDRGPEVVIVGAEAGEVRPFGDGLSAPLAAALPEVIRLVVRECATDATPPQ
jgi:hydrogenase maturation protease